MIAVSIAAVLVLPFFNVVNGVAGSQTVDNESVTATFTGNTGDWKELRGYDVDDSETVLWLNSSTGNYETLTEGTDYEFNYTDGAIRALSGGVVQDGDELLVSYTYQATSETTAVVLLITPLLLVLVILAAFSNQIDSLMRLGGY